MRLFVEDWPIPEGGVDAGLDDFAWAAEVIGQEVVDAAFEQADGEVVAPEDFLDRGVASFQLGQQATAFVVGEGACEVLVTPPESAVLRRLRGS